VVGGRVQQAGRGVPGQSDRIGLVAGGEGDHATFVEQVQLGTETLGSVVPGLLHEDREQPAHPVLLGPHDREGGVLGAADLGVGVHERATTPLLVEPALQCVEDHQHPVRAGPGVLREPVEHQPLPGRGPTPEVERDQSILGPEPVVERLLRRAGVLGDQLDSDGADPTRVEQ